MGRHCTQQLCPGILWTPVEIQAEHQTWKSVIITFTLLFMVCLSLTGFMLVFLNAELFKNLHFLTFKGCNRDK